MNPYLIANRGTTDCNVKMAITSKADLAYIFESGGPKMDFRYSSGGTTNFHLHMTLKAQLEIKVKILSYLIYNSMDK